MAQQVATTSKQLLAFGGQDKTAANLIEQLEPEFLLKLLNLPGKAGLRDMKRSAAFETEPCSATVTNVRRRLRSMP